MILLIIFVKDSHWLSLIVLPNNVSELHRLPIMMEYFINQKKYFYFILLHTYAIIFIGTLALIAIGSTFVAFIQHMCGMFRIAWYECRDKDDHNNLNFFNLN